MMAFLRFANGDRREITLDASHIRHGHPIETIVWRDGDDGLGGERVGERTFYLNVPMYRDTRTVRYDELPDTRRGPP